MELSVFLGLLSLPGGRFQPLFNVILCPSLAPAPAYCLSILEVGGKCMGLPFKSPTVLFFTVIIHWESSIRNLTKWLAAAVRFYCLLWMGLHWQAFLSTEVLLHFCLDIMKFEPSPHISSNICYIRKMVVRTSGRENARNNSLSGKMVLSHTDICR